jgi:glucan phosphoethanolaminetransferase (alkaline phosphatase superfamily)
MPNPVAQKEALQPASAATSTDTAIMLYVFIWSAYYFLNFVLRWSRYLVFSAHGAYGWPPPTQLQQVGIFAASFAGPFLIFCVAGLVAKVTARRHPLWLLVPLSVLVLCFVELDATWYTLSQEHVRLVDLELFLGLNVKAHLGIDASDMSRVILACVRHLVVLVASGIGVWWVTSKRPEWVRPTWVKRFLVVTGVAIFVAGNTAAYFLSVEQSWREISRSNRLNATISALVRKSEPAAREIQAMYDAPSPVPSANASSISPGGASAPNASVIVIALEGWNPSYIDDDMMPFVAKLRRESHVFRNHYSSGNNTLLGTLGLLYGQSPTFYFDHEATGQRSLFIEELNARGYRTGYFGEGLTSYRFIDGYLTNFSEGGNPVPVGDSAIRSIAAFVRKYPRTFTYYYYINTHFPYRHGERFAKYTPEVAANYEFDANDIRQNREAIANRYRNTLVEADDFIMRLLAELPWRNMIVVITGDHGESMLENGRLSHSSSLEEPQEGTTMSIYVPGSSPTIRDGVTSHLDVFPTIFGVLGIPTPPGAQGRDMLGSGERAALVMHNNQNRRPIEAALISGDAKMLLNLDDLGAPKFTGLLTAHDRPAKVAGREAMIGEGLDRLKSILGPDGCGLYGQASSRDSAASRHRDNLTSNLRHCPPAARAQRR